MEKVIEVEHLKKSFGKNTVLSDISFDLPRGRTWPCWEKSGTGKSVMIKCIVRHIEPDSGDIR